MLEFIETIILFFQKRKGKVPNWILFLLLILGLGTLFLLTFSKPTPGEVQNIKGTVSVFENAASVLQPEKVVVESTAAKAPLKLETNGSNTIAGFKTFKSRFEKLMKDAGYRSDLTEKVARRVEKNLRDDKLALSELNRAIANAADLDESSADVEKIRKLVIHAVTRVTSGIKESSVLEKCAQTAVRAFEQKHAAEADCIENIAIPFIKELMARSSLSKESIVELTLSSRELPEKAALLQSQCAIRLEESRQLLTNLWCESVVHVDSP